MTPLNNFIEKELEEFDKEYRGLPLAKDFKRQFAQKLVAKMKEGTIKTRFTFIDLDAENEDEKRIVLGFPQTPENSGIARKIFAEELEIRIITEQSGNK